MFRTCKGWSVRSINPPLGLFPATTQAPCKYLHEIAYPVFFHPAIWAPFLGMFRWINYVILHHNIAVICIILECQQQLSSPLWDPVVNLEKVCPCRKSMIRSMLRKNPEHRPSVSVPLRGIVALIMCVADCKLLDSYIVLNYLPRQTYT